MDEGLKHRVFMACFALVTITSPGLSAAGTPCDPTFTALPSFPVGNNFGTNALADLDGDGRMDLTTGMRFFLGDGTGAFTGSYELVSKDVTIGDIVVRDLNDDGLPDLALSAPNFNTLILNTILVLFRRATSSTPSEPFDAPVSLFSISIPWQLACLDVNEDGRLDIAGVSMAGADLAVHVNHGNRIFADPMYIPMVSSAFPIASADFDGDGHADIAVGHDSRATLLFGQGDGTFADGLVTPLTTPTGERRLAHRFCTGDIDQNGRSELLAICEDVVLLYRGTDIDPVLGLPPTSSMHYPISGRGRFLQIADMNNDGTLDLIIQTEVDDTSSVVVFTGVLGEGIVFVEGQPFSTGLSGHGSVLAVADVNGDTWADVVITTEDSDEGRVFLNDGNCCDPLFAERGDANADGAIDLGDPIAILSYLFASQPLTCRPAAELNRDGRIDLADPIYLLTYLFAHGPPPPSGGPLDCRAGR